MPKGIPKNGTNKGWFKKGYATWNKGLEGYLEGRISPMKGKNHSKKTYRRIQYPKESKETKKEKKEGKKNFPLSSPISRASLSEIQKGSF